HILSIDRTDDVTSIRIGVEGDTAVSAWTLAGAAVYAINSSRTRPVVAQSMPATRKGDSLDVFYWSAAGRPIRRRLAVASVNRSSGLLSHNDSIELAVIHGTFDDEVTGGAAFTSTAPRRFVGMVIRDIFSKTEASVVPTTMLASIDSASVSKSA